MAKNIKRPIFMDLLRIRMPVVAVLSFAHRVTGGMLCLLIPFVIYLLDLSLRDAQGYAEALAILASPAVKFMAVLLLWGFAHHLLAGIRFLLIDADIGVERDSARRSAWVVNVGGLIVPIIALVVLL
ncbi:MAG: succinate dehydrogenase, cytochrome b556 subunit [Gammaproteobacteria bacterium]|nr:succinate dehydrogenase, cytochrome b556 subunit [Gammaproteobacteria bacterium]